MNRQAAPEAGSAPSKNQIVAAIYFPSPSQLFFLLGTYFTLQTVSRTLLSSSLDLDESEAVVLAQRWSLGYGAAAPLYTWLQILLFQITGVSVFGLSLLKSSLLFSTYILTFLTAKLVTRSVPAATAACLSLLFLPTIAWESQRDLTHSVLASTISVATLYVFLRLQEDRTTRWYAILGLCGGLGLLSKYNYGLWLAGLFVAGLTMPSTRTPLLDRRMLLTIGITLAVFAPSGAWMLENRDLAFSTFSKFEVKQSGSALITTALGLKRLAQSVISVGAALAFIYAVLFIKAPAVATPQPVWPYRLLLLRAWAFVLVALVLFVVFTKATTFKERWFQPILVALPILAASLVQSRLSAVRLKWVACLALLVMVVVACVLPGRVLLAERLGREQILNRPYAEIAQQLQGSVPANSLLVCDTKLLAGNLRLHLPETKVSPPELTSLFAKDERHVFLAWDAAKRAELPKNLESWAHLHAKEISDLGTARTFSAVYYHHKGKRYNLRLLQLR